MKNSNRAGFTLLELIVVLVIVGFMVGMVLPRLFNSIAGIELKTAARETVTLLRQAAYEAYYKKQHIKASFNLDTHKIVISRYQIAAGQDNGGKSLLRPEMEWAELKEYVFKDTIEILQCVKKDAQTQENDVFDIFFSPVGNSSGGEITVGNARKKMVIMVDYITSEVKIRS